MKSFWIYWNRRHTRRAGVLIVADHIDHDYTLVQPTDSKYDFLATDKPPIQVVVVIVDDAIYAIYQITGVKRTGTTRTLTSPQYGQFDIEQGYRERDAKEFSAEIIKSNLLGRKVTGWTSPRNAVARYGGRLFENVTISHVDQLSTTRNQTCCPDRSSSRVGQSKTS